MIFYGGTWLILNLGALRVAGYIIKCMVRMVRVFGNLIERARKISFVISDIWWIEALGSVLV